jgi:hypothetical protein
VGCSGASVKEQALSDLTGSILATFPEMSNIFLHFRQVIDSKPQKAMESERKLWKDRGIASIKLLNKRDEFAGSYRLKLVSKFAPLLSSICQCEFLFKNPNGRPSIGERLGANR